MAGVHFGKAEKTGGEIVIRVEGIESFEGMNGQIVKFYFGKQYAAIAEGFGIGRIVFEKLFVGKQGVFVSPHFCEKTALVLHCLEICRVKTQGLFVTFKGGVELLQALLDDTEIEPDRRIVRFDCQRPLEIFEGLFGIAPVVLDTAE